MRHILYFALVASLATTVTSELAGQARIGIKGGLTIGRLSTEATDIDGFPFEVDDRLSFQVGGALAIPIGQVFEISTDIAYVREGFGLDVMPPAAALIDLDLNIDRLNIPLFAGIRFPIGSGVVTPRLYAGPFVAFELRCTSNTDSGGVTLEEGSCDEVDIERHKTDWGIAFGGGLDLATTSGAVFSLEGRYTIGLRNLNSSAPPDDDRFEARTFALLTGVSIPVGH